MNHENTDKQYDSEGGSVAGDTHSGLGIQNPRLLHSGKVVYSLRFWADSAGKAYGPRERSTLIGGIARQMRQLEEALKELDREGWELVSVSAWLARPSAARRPCFACFFPTSCQAPP